MIGASWYGFDGLLLGLKKTKKIAQHKIENMAPSSKSLSQETEHLCVAAALLQEICDYYYHY